MTNVFEMIEGWYQFFKMPANTTHIAYFYENGSVYLPEDGVGYKDWLNAVIGGHINKLIVVDHMPEVPDTRIRAGDVLKVIEAALQRDHNEIEKAD